MSIVPQSEIASRRGATMTELQNTTASDVVPYERGVSLKTVLRGVLKRFLPASAISLGVLGLALTTAGASGLALIPLLAGGLTLGFGLGMEGLRRWLYPDAKVDGRRSVVAGLLSPLLLFGTVALIETTGLGPIGAAGFTLLSGMIMALAMYFPWLTPTPEMVQRSEVEFERAQAWPSDEADNTQ